MNTASDTDRSATSEAADWLTDYLASQGGTAASKDIKAAGMKAGHSQDALKRARTRIHATSSSHGFPRQTFWSLPSQSEQPLWRVAPTAPTAPTESDKGLRGDYIVTPTALTDAQSVQSVQLVQSEQTPRSPIKHPAARRSNPQPDTARHHPKLDPEV